MIFAPELGVVDGNNYCFSTMEIHALPLFLKASFLSLLILPRNMYAFRPQVLLFFLPTSRLNVL